MAKKFRALVRETLSVEEQASAHAEARAMRLEMNLRDIREKLSELSQEDVAQLLDVTQPYISKLERQRDMLVSKLYDYIGTLGGAVEIHAKFPNREDVVVSQFEDLVQVFQVKDGARGAAQYRAQTVIDSGKAGRRGTKRSATSERAKSSREPRKALAKTAHERGAGAAKTTKAQKATRR